MSYRIYGKAGQKTVSGIMNDQFGGDQDLIVQQQNSGSMAMSSRPNVRVLAEEESNGTEANDAFVVTSKNSAVRDLADVGNGSETGFTHVPGEDEELYRGKMTTGIEVKKPTDNIYY